MGSFHYSKGPYYWIFKLFHYSSTIPAPTKTQAFTCMTVGSDMRVSAFTTSTTASATTAVFMHAISKPYTSSQNAIRSRCLSLSPSAARLMLQRSGYTNKGQNSNKSRKKQQSEGHEAPKHRRSNQSGVQSAELRQTKTMFSLYSCRKSSFLQVTLL